MYIYPIIFRKFCKVWGQKKKIRRRHKDFSLADFDLFKNVKKLTSKKVFFHYLTKAKSLMTM